MLKPNHFCAWSHSRHTYLNYQGGCFDTGGTSLPVLIDAFRQEQEPGPHWFSLAYGDVHSDEHENLLLVAVDADEPELPALEPYQEIGPLNKALLRSGGGRVEEYVLSDEVRAALRIGVEASNYSLQDRTRVRQALYLHDDCFGRVEPVDEGRLARLVHATLKLHSFYLEREVRWEGVLPELTRLLMQVEEFELVSHPKAGVVYVDWPHQIIRRKMRARVKPYRARISVGTAQVNIEMLDTA
jgi:hypothetical protein